MDALIVETEAERVEAWRLWTLIEAGYSHFEAKELARRGDVDLHQAVELVEAGCRPETAVRILL